MKKLYAITLALALLACVGLAIAGSVYARDHQTLGAATGTALWTNDSDYAAIALKRIWIEGSGLATSICTITRITTVNSVVYTQTVGSITCASGKGSTASLTASYLADGDKLRFANADGSDTTGGVVIVEYEYQKH